MQKIAARMIAMSNNSPTRHPLYVEYSWVKVEGLGFQVEGLEFEVLVSGCTVRGVGNGVWGVGF